MSRFLRALVALALVGGLTLVAPPSANAAPSERVRVIVELHNLDAARSVARSTPAASDIKTTTYSPYLIMEVPRQALQGLRRNPNVRAVTEDFAQAPSLVSSLPVINGDDVHTLGFTGSGATVAVLDTGIDTDHPFLGAGGSRIVAQHCFSTDNASSDTLCPDGTSEDTSADATTAQCLNGTANLCTHGTHVAGIVAGSRGSDPAADATVGDGVAPAAQVVAVQVFSRFNAAADCAPGAAPCVLTWSSDQILALDWVRGQAAAHPTWNLVASNMSLGGGMETAACDSDSRKAAIDANLTAGIATVVAAGNDGYLDAVGAPGCISSAFTVGATDDADALAGFSNRGPQVDVLAPGVGIVSSVPDDTYGSKSGTSMATPMVAGALAVLRAASPTRPLGSLLSDITSTGVPVTYATNSAGTTTRTSPRLNLLAALQAADQPPTVAVTQAAVTVAEGSPATNGVTASDTDGTIASVSASLGVLAATGSGTWNWSYTPPDGPATETVTITATDDKGVSATTSFTLTVTNVAPTVTIDSLSGADEGGLVTLTGHFTDPGTDTHTAGVDWGTTQGTEVSLTVTGTSVMATYRYGDNGSYGPVTLTVTDSDGASGFATGASAAVANVAPTAAITGPGATTWNGQQIIFGTAGTAMDFTAASSDPGSDDLTFDWAFGDGGTASHTSLVNAPATDPADSPTNQPRTDVPDTAPHTYSIACAATLGLTLTDDDGGSGSDTAQVVVLGTSTDAGTLGVWQTDFRDKRSKLHTAAEKECLLSVVRVLSSEFSEVRTLDTINDAATVLYPKNTANPTDQFDAMLLALWLNVADGSIRLSDGVDSDNDGTVDTTVGAVLQSGEALRLSPSPDRSELLRYKSLYEAINAAH